MMAANPFQVVLSKELQVQSALPAGLGILQEFCRGVEASTEGKVLCRLESGYLVNDGQEWKPVLQSADGGPRHILLRAYVPVDGWPVKLNLYNGPMIECNQEDELRSRLEGFLRDRTAIDQIRLLMQTGS